MKVITYIALIVSIVALGVSIFAIVNSPTETELSQGIQGPTGLQGEQGSPGISGYEIVTQESESIEAGSNGAVIVACPVGKKLLGGGCDFIGWSGYEFTLGQSNPEGNSWYCEGSHSSESNIDPVKLKAFAICANVNE